MQESVDLMECISDAAGDTQGEGAPLINVADVSLSFPLHVTVIGRFRGNAHGGRRRFMALNGINLELRAGDRLGIVGRNGSGKSTLAYVLAGVYKPDRGRVKINGTAQLLTLGPGFHPDLTGRENVYASAGLLGLRRQEARKLIPEIEAFAELGPFFDESVRTYSSGMRGRLGFAVATAIGPDILIIDEVMATGDRAFRDKAMRRMKSFQDTARAMVFISHNPGQVKSLCNRVIWMHQGQIVLEGEPAKVISEYNQFSRSPDKYFSEARLQANEQSEDD